LILILIIIEQSSLLWLIIILIKQTILWLLSRRLWK